MTSSPRGASVIIPAHDEGAVLARCLTALEDAKGADDLDLEIIVVPNGCSDDTADVARRHPGVLVVELPEPGKSAALEAGDEVATRFPRIFLDADIRLEAGALAALIDALSTTAPRVASPRVVFDTHRASPGVRSFYRVFRRLPYVRDRLVGLGVYGLSESGRARFDGFPDLVADDLFIQRLFGADERTVVPGHFRVQAPRDLRNLLRVRTRVARGNRELAASSSHDSRFDESTDSTTRALVELARREPARIGDILVYTVVTLVARHRARGGPQRWERDESTRLSSEV